MTYQVGALPNGRIHANSHDHREPLDEYRASPRGYGEGAGGSPARPSLRLAEAETHDSVDSSGRGPRKRARAAAAGDKNRVVAALRVAALIAFAILVGRAVFLIGTQQQEAAAAIYMLSPDFSGRDLPPIWPGAQRR